MNKKNNCLCFKCSNYKTDLKTNFFCRQFIDSPLEVDSTKCLCEKCSFHKLNQFKFKLYCHFGTEEKQSEM